MNPIIRETTGAKDKTLDFKSCMNDCWKYAMEHFDTQLKTAQSISA